MKIWSSRKTFVTAALVTALAATQGLQTGPAGALIGQASAEEDAGQETTLEQYCRHWARNGVMGAKVHHRNGPRKITYIDDNELRYLLKHQVAGDNLYLMKGDYSAEETRYLEESLLAGYDRMVRWVREHGAEAPDFAAWEGTLFNECMADVPQAIQALRSHK